MEKPKMSKEAAYALAGSRVGVCEGCGHLSGEVDEDGRKCPNCPGPMSTMATAIKRGLVVIE